MLFFVIILSPLPSYASLCQSVPWFSDVLRNLPYFGEPMRAFGLFGFQRAKIRYEQEPVRKDLFYHLVSMPYVCYSHVSLSTI